MYPPKPLSLQNFGEILLQEQYFGRWGSTKDGKEYFRTVLVGSEDEGISLVWLSENFMGLMSSCESFHIDGHFKSVPNVAGVYQQLTIMPVDYDHVSTLLRGKWRVL